MGTNYSCRIDAFQRRLECNFSIDLQELKIVWNEGFRIEFIRTHIANVEITKPTTMIRYSAFLICFVLLTGHVSSQSAVVPVVDDQLSAAKSVLINGYVGEKT